MQGRFLTADPFPGLLTTPASLNPYVYVLSNPILYTDPSGENPFIAAFLIGGFFGAGVNLGAQLYSLQPQSFSQFLHCVNWGSVAVSFSAGAVAGLVGITAFSAVSLTFGTGFAANVAGGAFSGFLAGQYSRMTELALTGQTQKAGQTLLRPQDILMDATIGGLLGAGLSVIEGIVARPASASMSKPTPNEIGAWGEQQASQNLPIELGPFRVQAQGQNRYYDARFTTTPNGYVEIKTSTRNIANVTGFIRRQVAFDANLAAQTGIPPTWIFVNAKPSMPLIRLLHQSHIPWTQLHIP